MAMSDWLNELGRLRVLMSKGHISFSEFIARKGIIEGNNATNNMEGLDSSGRLHAIESDSRRVETIKGRRT